MERFKVGIIEAGCPEGAELVRLLLGHPMVELFAVSVSGATGRRYSELYPRLFGIFDDICLSAEEVIARSDIVFGTPAMADGEEIAALCVKSRCVFISLAPDFRIADKELYFELYGRRIRYDGLHEASVYSIPELTGDRLTGRVLVSVPEAQPTAAALALAPCIAAELIEPRGIIIDAKNGCGWGENYSESFASVHGSSEAYSCGGHRHEPEIEQVLTELTGLSADVMYVPHRVPIARGVLLTCYAKKTLVCSEKTMRTALERAYGSCPFIRILPEGVQANAGAVAGTNICDISVTVREDSDTAIICAALDPLVKGAAGQAVQSMNILLSLPEETGVF